MQNRKNTNRLDHKLERYSMSSLDLFGEMEDTDDFVSIIGLQFLDGDFLKKWSALSTNEQHTHTSAKSSTGSGIFPIISDPVNSFCVFPSFDTSKTRIFPEPVGDRVTCFAMWSARSWIMLVFGSKKGNDASSLLCMPVQITFKLRFVSNSTMLTSSFS